MTGCFVSWKCRVACLRGEESQHPTWPQVRHSRSATQGVFSIRHSSHAPGVRGGGKSDAVSPFRCSHDVAIGPSAGRTASIPWFSLCFRRSADVRNRALPTSEADDGGRAPPETHEPSRNMRRRCVARPAASLTRKPFVQRSCRHRALGDLPRASPVAHLPVAKPRPRAAEARRTIGSTPTHRRTRETFARSVRSRSAFVLLYRGLGNGTTVAEANQRFEEAHMFRWNFDAIDDWLAL